MTDEIAPAPPPAPPRAKRRIDWGKWVTSALGVLLIIGVVAHEYEENRGSYLLQKGATVPDVPMATFGGGVLQLSQHRGKVVMLDFWATWCGPCKEEMPHLLKVAKEYEDKGLVFVAASRDDVDVAKELVDRFIHATKMEGLAPHVAFANDELAYHYRVKVLPTVYFIDREGKVIKGIPSAMSERKIRAEVEAALATP